MYKLNFNELVNNYIEKIKSRQLKRKFELLDILLLVILGLTSLGFIILLICNKGSLALLFDFIMITEVSFLWIRNKNYEKKHSKEIEFRKNENMKIKQNCLRECLCEKSIDIDDEGMPSLVLNEFNFYLQNNKSAFSKFLNFYTSFIFPLMIAVVGVFSKDIYLSLFFLIAVCLLTAYIIGSGIFAFKGMYDKDYYREEIHDILLDINLRNAQKK